MPGSYWKDQHFWRQDRLCQAFCCSILKFADKQHLNLYFHNPTGESVGNFCEGVYFSLWFWLKRWGSHSKWPGVHFQKHFCYLLDWKPFKCSFRSQDTYIFVTTFWPCRKNGLIRKIKLTSKSMTSQPGLQTIAINILSNISQRKSNQTMKFGQLIEYNKRIFFFKNYAENEACRLVPEFFLFLKKSLIWGETKWSAAYFRYISIALNLP